MLPSSSGVRTIAVRGEPEQGPAIAAAPGRIEGGPGVGGTQGATS